MKKNIILIFFLIGILSTNVFAQRKQTTLGKIIKVTDRILHSFSCGYNYCNIHGYHTHNYYSNYSYPAIFRHRTYIRYGVRYCKPSCNTAGYKHYYDRQQKKVQTTRPGNQYVWCPFKQNISHPQYVFDQYGRKLDYCNINNCNNPHYINKAYLGVPKASSPYGW